METVSDAAPRGSAARRVRLYLGELPVAEGAELLRIVRTVLPPAPGRCDTKGPVTTLRRPQLEHLSPEDRAILERVAKRMGHTPEEVINAGIFGAQAHWPAWLEANHAESSQAYRLQGALPPIAKEAMHVAVSMANDCAY